MSKKGFLPSITDSETLTEKIRSSLEDAILEGKIKPNGRLFEEELSKTFKTSRAPIREALRLLERDGFIKIIPRKGAVVQGISSKDILDVYEIRSVLEGLAARLFCIKANDKELRKLQSVYEAMEGLRIDSNTVKRNKRYKKLNREFHDTFITLSNNKKIMDIYTNFQKQINWFQNVTLSFDIRFDLSLKEHGELLDCFLRRDAEGAEKRAREHIENSINIILKANLSEMSGSDARGTEEERKRGRTNGARNSFDSESPDSAGRTVQAIVLSNCP